MTNQEPTNFKLLEKEYANIITFSRETDDTGARSTAFSLRKTYVLIDGWTISIHEVYIKNKTDAKIYIDYYHYNVYKDNKSIIKFHSETHDDPSYQTSTEPFHIHIGLRRLDNKGYKKLSDVLEYLRLIIFSDQQLNSTNLLK